MHPHLHTPLPHTSKAELDLQDGRNDPAKDDYGSKQRRIGLVVEVEGGFVQGRQEGQRRLELFLLKLLLRGLVTAL
jgi:hypothetical protein